MRMDMTLTMLQARVTRDAMESLDRLATATGLRKMVIVDTILRTADPEDVARAAATLVKSREARNAQQ